MIDLLPSPEQQQIADAVTALLHKEFPDSRLLSTRGRIVNDRAAWPVLIEQGWLGLGLSEELGGVGYGKPELALLHRELGRHLVGPAVLATTLAATASALSGNMDLSASLMGGERLAAIGLLSQSGKEFFIIDGQAGDVVLCLQDGGAAIYDHDRLQRSDATGVDQSLRLQRAQADEAALLFRLERTEAFSALCDLLVGAELVGIAEATCARAAEYARTRQQFGQPIGSFQAIKHKCAEMLVRAEVGWAQIAYASIFSERQGIAAEALAGRLVAANAATLNGEDNIQVHGAIGYTAEFDAHLFLKRAQLLSLIGGTPAEQHRRLLEAAVQE